MKRAAKITGHVLCYAIMECPFCRSRTVENPTMPWCVNCRVEYYDGKEDPKTDARRVLFDDKRKTPRYAWGKALNAAGGMKIGKS